MKDEIVSAVLSHDTIFGSFLMKSYSVTTSVLSTERRCELKGLPSLMSKSTC